MDALDVEFRIESPDAPAIAQILKAHLQLMRASSTARSMQALGATGLLATAIDSFAIYCVGHPVAIRALSGSRRPTPKSSRCMWSRRGGVAGSRAGP